MTKVFLSDVLLHNQSLEKAQQYVTEGERSEPSDKNAPYSSASKKSNNVRRCDWTSSKPLEELELPQVRFAHQRLRIVGRFHRLYQIFRPLMITNPA